MCNALEVASREVVLEVRVVVTRLPRLSCGEIAALWIGKGRQHADGFSGGASHAKSFKKVEVFCTTAEATTSPNFNTVLKGGGEKSLRSQGFQNGYSFSCPPPKRA